jgi:hypothetical protein
MPAPAGYPQAKERALQGSGSLGLHRCSPLIGQRLLGPCSRLFGPCPVDLLRPLGGIRQNDHMVRRYLQETACHGEVLLLAVDSVHQLASIERRKHGFMAMEDADVPLGRTGHDDIDVFLQHDALRRHNFETDCRHRLALLGLLASLLNRSHI